MSAPAARRSRSLRGLGLTSRIAAALLAVGALLVGVVAISAVLQQQIQQEQKLVVVDYYWGLRDSQNYFVNMLNAETGVRGYALSGGDSAALDPLRQSGRPWEHPISPGVQARLPKERASVARMRQVERDSLAWYRDWAAPAIAKTQAGERLTPADVVAGKRRFDLVRADFNAYISGLRGGREAAAERLSSLTNLLFVAVVASALLAVVAGFLLWGLMRRWVSRPVATLAGETRAVTEGDLEHEVTVAGPPEFVQLAGDVEAMRKRLVAQIAAAEAARLEVAQARASLEEQTEELQRSNRELEQFAYVASHDLQEPLRKVASFCQMLERRYAGQLDERADQYIHFAVDGAKRMQHLINDLLEFSRVGRLTSPQVDVDLADCLRGALANLETAREESGAEITWDPLPTVRGEAPLLTQLLQNLVGNAIKFRSQAAPKIHIGAHRDGDFWEFSCSDNGIGIEPEYAERVFLIFQRLHPKEVYSGTGIGLAMGKKIVEHHGGRIWVALGNGPGATVRWTLPAIDAQPDASPDPAGVRAGDAGTVEVGP